MHQSGMTSRLPFKKRKRSSEKLPAQVPIGPSLENAGLVATQPGWIIVLKSESGIIRLSKDSTAEWLQTALYRLALKQQF